MKSKYPKMMSGDPVPIELGRYVEDNFIKDGTILNFACCDCGMVHLIVAVPIPNRKINLHHWSEPRKTAALRRNHFGNLHKGSGKWKLVRK